MTVRGVFVTGTDTGIGKTRASALLVRAQRACGRRAIGMKPVASGCRETSEGLRNEDAEALIAASDPAPPYALCNPYAFAPPIAPHIAAREAAVAVALDPIIAAYRTLAGMADRVVVEGVGGWAVPLSDALMQADLVRALDVPVVLVVGLRLGCINHALLSARAIRADGCVLAGWIANRIDPDMARDDENLATLSARIDAPLLGVLAHSSEPRDADVETLAAAAHVL
ncbi:MAG TPA: dethiobiotin synthase [Rhodanobacteraceae bacterium]|nr:dethiobiotin synthase [Rhodanobacteraceae bacterium]